jgi:hypothetical protein
MLSWQRSATLALLLLTLGGCRSAHIKDVYISRDDDGVRRTSCIQPQWQHYYVMIELMSFSEDTLLWPFLVDGGGNVLAPPIADGDDDLVEFGNMAPGKSDQIIAIEFKETEPGPSGQPQAKDLTEGFFTWHLYLDDEEEPRESVNMQVAPNCPCVGTVVGNCG